MDNLEELKQKITNLPAAEYAEFRDWFAEFDHLLWDRQIAADSKAGKLDKLIR